MLSDWAQSEFSPWFVLVPIWQLSTHTLVCLCVQSVAVCVTAPMILHVYMNWNLSFISQRFSFVSLCSWSRHHNFWITKHLSHNFKYVRCWAMKIILYLLKFTHVCNPHLTFTVYVYKGGLAPFLCCGSANMLQTWCFDTAAHVVPIPLTTCACLLPQWHWVSLMVTVFCFPVSGDR